MTTREREAPCAMLADLTLPWLISMAFLPVPLETSAKSNAIRAGVCTTKPAGTSVSGSERSMRITSAPLWVKPVTDWITPALASVEPAMANKAMPAVHSFSRRLFFLLIIAFPLDLPAGRALPDVRSSHPSGPGQFLSYERWFPKSSSQARSSGPGDCRPVPDTAACPP